MFFRNRSPAADGSPLREIKDGKFDYQYSLNGLVHADHSAAYSENLANRRGFLADFAAATVVGLVKSGYLSLDHFMQEQLELCSNIIQNAATMRGQSSVSGIGSALGAECAPLSRK